MAQAAVDHSQSHGALVFMATEHGLGIGWGSFLVWEENGRPEKKKGKRAKVLRRRSSPHFRIAGIVPALCECRRPRDLDAMFAPISR